MSMSRSSRRLAALVVASFACSIAACGDDGGSTEDGTGAVGSSGTETADSTGSAPFDEAQVIEMASQYATALERINAQPFTSQHAIAASVSVYVDSGAAEMFRMLDPEAPVDLDFPEGTLIVKEHLDAEGSPDGFNLMYRGPEGYDPMASDWYWARVTADGTAAESGAIGYCISCHAAAPGHAFGVATDNRL